MFTGCGVPGGQCRGPHLSPLELPVYGTPRGFPSLPSETLSLTLPESSLHSQQNTGPTQQNGEWIEWGVYEMIVTNEMIDVLGHDSALLGYTRPGTTWANEMNFVMNHAPSAGSIDHDILTSSPAHYH